MKITTTFTKQFEWETLQSEKLRAAILAVYSLFTFIYIFCITLIINDQPQTGAVNEFPLPYTLLIFLFVLFIYEFIANRVLNFRLKKIDKRAIHPSFKYITALVEVTIITIMLYLFSMYFKQRSSLLSDIIMVSLYYLVVFLSAFYLDKIISVVTGAIAAVAYVSINVMNQPAIKVTQVDELWYNKYFIYATGVLLFLAGIAAAFLANQLRKGVMRSLELVEDEHKLFDLFSRQITKEIAMEIMDSDGKVPSETKFVCVMFIDIRNFTVYAEAQTPEDLVAFQNAFFGVIVEVVNKYQGIVNQFLGDGCMITFGAPIEIENPAQHAIKAALEIKKTIEEKIKKGEMHHFKIGIGIHCGNAVTGNIGTSLKSEYSITGGVVILAARIEQFNKQVGSQILLSREAFEAADIPDLKPELATEASLKGWSHPVELYKLA